MSATGTPSLLLALLLVLVELSSATSEHCVVPSPANPTSGGCRTLDEYVENKDYYNWTDAMFVFHEGIHNHSNELILSDKTNLVLTGVAEDRVTINCFKGTGFVFCNVINLTIANLTFAFCGQIFKWGNITSASALAFFFGHTLTIESITVNSATFGAVHTESVSGDIVVSECQFVNSHVEESPFMSGSRFMFTECSHYMVDSPSSRLMISQTQFINNTITSLSNKKCTHQGGIWAGGASILIQCPNVTATLDDVHFERNLGCFGGALTLTVGSSSISTNQVRIMNSSFHNNSGWYGGAIIIDVYYHCSSQRIVKEKTKNLLIEIRNSTFTDNSAKWSGGALYIRHKESSNPCTAGTIKITLCTFKHNSLKSFGGVAIFNVNYIAYSVVRHIVPQYYVALDRCLLEDNYVQNNKWNNSGSGVIVTETNPYFEIKDTSIINNECSGLVAITSNIIFRREVNITNNYGASGGGLLLCSGAILYFNHNAILTIASNSVHHQGGGILVEYDCRQAKPTCFFQHLPHDKSGNSTAVVYLYNNTAYYAGDNLYGGAVEHCTILSDPHKNASFPKSSTIFSELFPDHPSYNDTTVTSAPTRVCFCHNKTPSCKQENQSVTLSPGGKITIEVVLVGQWNSPSPGTMEAKIQDKAIQFSNGKSFEVFDMMNHCKTIELTVQNTNTQSQQNGQHSIELYVTTSSDISFTEHLDDYKSIYIYVELENCPFGFNINDNTNECNCNYLRHHFVSCNSSSNSWKFDPPGRTWLGKHEIGNMSYLAVADNCPVAFCNAINNSVHSNSTSLVNPKSQCRTNRAGVLCGDCDDGYSLILGGDDCVKDCHYETLSLIIVFLAMGLLLVFFLTIFDLTVAEGTIGGILFYANIFQINSNLYLHTQSEHKTVAAVCKTFIAWLNLDFGIPTCFYKGMNSYDKAWLQFLFPLYIWLLAGLIIFISKKNARIAALFRTNCVKVLSTLILLSYAKLTRLTMEIFRYHKIFLYQIDGSDLQKATIHNKVHKWAYDGKMEYFTKSDHLPLFIAGVVSVAILAPYTLCLLFIRRLYQNSSHRALWWINKWRPFFDTYVGPYTSAGYCWTGLQLLARVLVLVANEAQSTELTSTLLTLVVVAFLVVAAWWTESRIYKKRGHNILEGVSLLNLIILQLATAYILTSNHSDSTIWYSFISVFLTMGLFVGVVCYHGYRQLFSLTYFKARSSGIKKWISNPQSSPETELDEDDNHNPSSHLPSVVGLRDREPLLAEDD